MPKSKFFRVAVAGATTDGRTIEENSLTEMAASYNPITYTARINLEHIRGFSADPPFNAYGDVISLKTETIDLDIGGKTEKRLALFAEINALDPLVEMNKKGQKLFTSIEINPNFGGTGKAYLMGLAVTDSPASLGTEMLKFCATQGANSPLAARKQAPHHELSEGLETAIELTDEKTGDDATGFAASFKTFMDKLTGAIPTPQTPPVVVPPVKVDDVKPDANFTALAALVGQIGTAVEGFTKAQAEENRKLREDLSALSKSIDTTAASGHEQRPLGTGPDQKFAVTDC